MGIIPLNEPRGDGPDTDRNGSENNSLVDRFRSGLQAMLLALPGAPVVARETEPDQSESVTPSPDRTTPTPLPGSATSEVEIVSTNTTDALIVEAVDNPDATVTSDTWESVER